MGTKHSKSAKMTTQHTVDATGGDATPNHTIGLNAFQYAPGIGGPVRQNGKAEPYHQGDDQAVVAAEA